MEKTNEEILKETKNKFITKEKFWGVMKGFGTIILYFILTGIFAFLFRDFLTSPNKTVVGISQVLVYLLILIILCLIYHKRLIHDFKNFKKDNLNIAVKNWLIGLALMMASNIIITWIIGDIAANETANRELLTRLPISSFFTMVIIAPLIEEITFRASFKQGFDKWYTFALTTGLLFGLAHIADFKLLELLFIIPYSSLGFFFAKAFYETNNIFTSYIAHLIHNGLVILTLLLF